MSQNSVQTIREGTGPSEGKRPLVLPTHKAAPSIATPRALETVAKPSDYHSKVISRKLERVRIQRDRDAAAAGFFRDRASFQRALTWNDRHLIGEPRDLRNFLFVKQRDSSGTPVEYTPYAELAEEFSAVVLSKLPQRTNDPILLEHLPSIEEAQLAKIGPKSQYKSYAETDLHERMEELTSEKGPLHLNLSAMDKAVDFIKAMLPRNSVPMASVEEVWNTLPQEQDLGDLNSPSLDGTTNSGPDFYIRKWRDLTGKDPYRTAVGKDILKTAKYYINYLKKGVPVPQRAIMAHRLTMGGHNAFDTKERPVIAMEKFNAVAGKVITYYLLEALRDKRHGLFEPYGNTFVALRDAPYLDIEMQRIFNYARRDSDLVINSSDVSAFDSSVNSNLIMLAGEIIGSWMKGGQKYVRALAESMAAHTTILTPTGLILPTRGGVKSGDGLTNLIDSVVSLLVFAYGHFCNAYELHLLYAQGDDGIQVAKGCTPAVIADVYAECGFDANTDKQWQVPGTIMYLQNLFRDGYRGGIRPVSRSFGSVLTNERYKFKPEEWSPEAQTVSIISSLENSAFNPLFDDMVEFVAAGDRYHLHSNIVPASKILRRAGQTGHELLIKLKEGSMNKQVSDYNESGFDRGITNGVLRKTSYPSKGSDAYWRSVYHKRADDLRFPE